MERHKRRQIIAAASVLGVVMIAGLAGFFYSHEPPHQEPIPDAAAPTTLTSNEGSLNVASIARALRANTKTLSRLRGEMKLLREKIALLEQTKKPAIALVPPSANNVPQIEDEWVADDLVEVDPETQFEEEKMRSRERFDSIETAFASEAVDQVWGDAVGSEVQRAFESVAELNNAYLDAMECRAQRCRLEVEFADDAELEAAQANLAFALVDLAPRMAVEYEDVPGEPGRKRAVMYFARTGYKVLED